MSDDKFEVVGTMFATQRDGKPLPPLFQDARVLESVSFEAVALKAGDKLTIEKHPDGTVTTTVTRAGGIVVGTEDAGGHK